MIFIFREHHLKIWLYGEQYNQVALEITWSSRNEIKQNMHENVEKNLQRLDQQQLDYALPWLVYFSILFVDKFNIAVSF